MSHPDRPPRSIARVGRCHDGGDEVILVHRVLVRVAHRHGHQREPNQSAKRGDNATAPSPYTKPGRSTHPPIRSVAASIASLARPYRCVVPSYADMVDSTMTRGTAAAEAARSSSREPPTFTLAVSEGLVRVRSYAQWTSRSTSVVGPHRGAGKVELPNLAVAFTRRADERDALPTRRDQGAADRSPEVAVGSRRRRGPARPHASSSSSSS